MPELWRSSVTVVTCLADARTLDLMEVAGVVVWRVAADETLLVAPHAERHRVKQDALEHIGPDGLVVDQSSGWVCWTIVGPRPDEVLARLSAVPPAETIPSFSQGAFAGVQAKMLVRDQRLDVFVASTVDHHVRRRILTACSDFNLQEASSREFDVPKALSAGSEASR